jgi:hypothetical protein
LPRADKVGSGIGRSVREVMCRDACSSKLDELRCRTVNPPRDVAGPESV